MQGRGWGFESPWAHYKKVVKIKIINKENCRDFIERCVPTLKNDEVLIYFVFVRKKYCPQVRNHHQMVFRDILKDNDPNYIIPKIEKIPDRFIDYQSSIYYGENCYALYIDLIPKSTLKAYIHFSKEIQDLIYQSLKNDSQLKEFRKIKNRLLSAIHKKSSWKPFIMIDIDSKDNELLEEIYNQIDWTPIYISETRGGYHLIYEKTSAICRDIYENLRKDEDLIGYFENKTIEIQSEVMTPVVGTLQGGFEVKEYKI